MIDLDKIVGFDWDEGNQHKILLKHNVRPVEAEQVFDDDFVMFFKDTKHSERELRYHALGQSKNGRHLQISFTLRDDDTLIRVISARDMDAKERACYD